MAVQQIGELLRDPQKLTKHLFKVLITSLALALVSMFYLDQRLSLFFSREEVYSIWYQPARKLTDLGLFEFYFVIALGTWAFAKWGAPHWSRFRQQPQKIEFLRRWGLNFIAALFFSGLLTHLIKALVGRQRPHKSPTFDPFVFSPLTTHWHWHSFSSGHTQVMFTVATMMTLALPKWRWLWLTLAMIISFTRIMVADHFLSDVIFGAAVGYMGTLMALFLMQRKSKNGLF